MVTINCCYELVGLKIGLAETPQLLEEAIKKALRLSRTEATDCHLLLKGRIAEDNAFLKTMPPFIRKKYNSMQGGGDSVIITGPEREIALLAKGMDSSSFAYCPPPYKNIELCCQKLTRKATPLLFQSVLMPMVSELLLQRGKLMMHAGCVVTPEGDAILLLADSGGGKTTTVLSMVREGFLYLSDDLVVATRTDDGYYFEPIRETMNITLKTAGFFPELSFARALIDKSDESKVPIDPKIVFTKDQIIDHARASSILIISMADGPRLKILDASEMLKSLLKSNTFAQRASIARSSIESIWALLDQCKLFELRTGFDPRRLGNWMACEAASGNVSNPSPTLEKEHIIKKSIKRNKTSNHRKVSGVGQPTITTLLQALLARTLDGKRIEAAFAHHLAILAGSRKFVLWLKYHRIVVHMAQYLAGITSDMTHAVTLDFRSHLAQARAQSILMQKNVRTIFEELAVGNIPAMMSRGPALAASYFPQPFLRPCRDIDIIIPQQNLRAAERVIVDRGFRLMGDRQYWESKGELPYTNEQVTLEIHWDAYPALNLGRWQPQDFWEQPVRIKLDGFSVNMLNTNHLLLSSCLHLTREHYLDRLVRLIDIRQIINIDKNDIDWDWVVHQAITGGQRFAVWLALCFAVEIVQAKVPYSVLKQIYPTDIWGRIGIKLFPPKSLLLTPSTPSRLRRRLLRRVLGKAC